MNFRTIAILLLLLVILPAPTQAKAKLIFTFDDYTSTVGAQLIEQALSANGQRGIVFVITNDINSADLTQLQTVYNLGWDVSSHTKSHAHLTLLNASALDDELQGSYDFLANNGMAKSARFFAYPYGEYNTAVTGKTEEIYLIGRTIDIGINHLTNYTPYKLKRLVNSNYPTSVATHTDAIDSLIAADGLGIFVFHGLVESNPTTYTYLASDFQQISDYAKAKSDAGLLDVVTFSDIFPASNANDMFNNVILTSKWWWVRENASAWMTTDSYFQMNVTNTKLSVAVDDASILLQNISVGTNSTIETVLSFEPATNYEQAGIIYYVNDSTYIRLIYLDGGVINQAVQLSREEGGALSYNYSPAYISNPIYLKIEKIGTTYIGYYKSNETNWTAVPLSYTLNTTPTDIGIVTAGDGSSSGIPAKYYLFKVTSDSLTTYIPPQPVFVSTSTGNFYVNTSWTSGTGYVTNGYNITNGSMWFNGTATYLNETLSPHGISDLYIYPFNNSGGGSLGSALHVTTQVPNNPVVLVDVNLSYQMAQGEQLIVDANHTDTDNDDVSYALGWNSIEALHYDTWFYTDTGILVFIGNDVGNYTFTIWADDYYSEDSQEFVVEVTPSAPAIPSIFCNYGNFWINCTAVTAKEWVVYQNE